MHGFVSCPKEPKNPWRIFSLTDLDVSYIAHFLKTIRKRYGAFPVTGSKPEWGAQRVKGLSMTKAVSHAVKKMICRDRSIGQKDTETTLIEQFLYPKFGPGQMWEVVARRIQELGGEIRLGTQG